MRIVFVCTTNVWGSAMAELISRRLLSEWDPDRERVQVFSVGVRAEVGAPMPAVAQQVLAERGIDASEHRARWMSPAVLGGADLTLTMGGIQRDAVLALNPRGLRSTFTLQEAAVLLRGLPQVVGPMSADADGHFRAVVAALAGARRFRSVAAGADDLPDLLADLRVVGPLSEALFRDVSGLLRALILPAFRAGDEDVWTGVPFAASAVA
ncbi:hypothetical protein [Klenkia terrae]|uniref:Phosphotyrosine protein phosphatase I domain-containing protein n=1 Tax=Klenkia terrae TaxID=1052259 RepID=A0ABU8E412_9ACTN|nr:hypothetical protein [Klenkia terrae]